MLPARKFEKTSIDWVKYLLQRIEQKHSGLVFPKYDDYYMEKVIFTDLFVDDQFEEYRRVSEFARNEQHMKNEQRLYYLIVDPPQNHLED